MGKSYLKLQVADIETKKIETVNLPKTEYRKIPFVAGKDNKSFWLISRNKKDEGGDGILQEISLNNLKVKNQFKIPVKAWSDELCRCLFPAKFIYFFLNSYPLPDLTSCDVIKYNLITNEEEIVLSFNNVSTCVLYSVGSHEIMTVLRPLSKTTTEFTLFDITNSEKRSFVLPDWYEVIAISATGRLCIMRQNATKESIIVFDLQELCTVAELFNVNIYEVYASISPDEQKALFSYKGELFIMDITENSSPNKKIIVTSKDSNNLIPNISFITNDIIAYVSCTKTEWLNQTLSFYNLRENKIIWQQNNIIVEDLLPVSKYLIFNN